MSKRFLVLWVLYGAALAALVFASAVIAVDDVAIAIVYMTCGLGLPLLFVPTLAAYTACLAPAVLVAADPRRRWAGLLLSVVTVLAVAVLPRRLSEAAAEAEVARLTADDVSPTVVSARSLEIVRPEGDHDLRDGPFGEELCDERCRALLLADEVDWVRVVRVPRRPEPDAPVAVPVRFVRAAGAACTAPGEPEEPNAECVLFREDTGEPADLVLTLEEARSRDPLLSPATALLRPHGLRRLTASRPSEGDVVLRLTEVHVETLIAPTILGPILSAESSGGIEAMRRMERFGVLDLDAVLRALGFPLAQLDALRALPPPKRDWPNPPDADLTRQVVSLLDLPDEVEFTPDQQQLISRWLAASRSWRKDGGWTAERVAIVRRIVRETRSARPWSLDQVVGGSPAVAAAVAADVVELSEAHGFPNDRPWRQAWFGLDQADPAVLAPLAPRILALVDANPDEARLLLPVVGRLGVDPSPWLLPLAADVDPELRSERVRGACHAEARWGALFIAPLRDLLAGLDLEESTDRDLAELTALALLRHGDEAWVEAALKPRGEEAARLWRRYGPQLSRTPDRLALCR